MTSTVNHESLLASIITDTFPTKLESVALFTQRSHIITAAALRLLKRRGSTHHVDNVCVFPQCPLVNLNTYPLTAYNHMDADIM